MKEYKYTIIRRESRNPKRNREGRGISQSDIEALKQELAGESRGIISAITDRDLALDNLTSSVGDLTLTSTDLSQRLKIAEESVQSHGKTLSGQAQALASQAQLLADQGQRLTTQGESLTDQSQRLTTAEQALTDKLDSGEFGKWQREELAKALASKQPAGSYALTSELATSQQQAVAEAVKRAGEMDKQIKVGGRNLIVTSRWKAGYLYGDMDENAYPVGSESYKVLVGYDTFRFDPVYIPTLGEREVTYKLYDNGGFTNGTVQIHAYDKDKKFLWWSVDGWDGTIGHTNAWTLPTDTAYIRLGVTNENVRAKVEFGTVVTDWTPAPEDVEESVRTVNTSVTSLTSQLLDPEQGEIHKLTSQLESHKTATTQSFAELSEHPLTVDKDGYWQVWNLKQQQYVTTQYQSRGQDAGRYLGRAKRIHPDFNGNYLLETDTAYNWLTAKEGDYVYLVGDLSNRGGDKDTYYIVREHKSKTVWEVYNIKGRSPVLTLDSQYHLLADGEMVSQQSLKGRDGEDGHSPVIKWNGTKLIIDDQPPVDLRGEAGHSPSATEVLSTDSFRQRLTSEVTSEVTTQVAPVNQRIDAVKETADKTSTDLATANTKLEAVETKADNSLTGLNNLSGQVSRIEGEVQTATQGVSDLKTFETSATSQLTDLDKRSLTTDQKRDLGYLTNSLQVLRSAGNNTLEGLALQRLIALSSNNETISAYLASNALPAVLKAGITGFGTANEREQVEITHQGTGHIGNLYFTGSQIDFKTGRYDAPYLSIGAEEATFIDNFIATARLDDTPVSVDTVTLSESSKVYERTISVDNTGTRLTVVIDQLTVQLYNLAKARLLLDGEELASWQGSQQISEGGGLVGGFKPEYKPYKGRNLSYERVVKAGSHTLRLEIAGKMGSGDSGATVKGLQVRRRYDTGAQQSALTKSGLRLFASPDRYFDVDYRRKYAPGGGQWFTPNPYLVRIKGGAKVDKLTADELDAPGVPLCGASFNERGGQIKAFGKYVNQRGYSRAQAEYDNGMAAFKVYHSIGHTNYIPIVQVSGFASNDINWSLTPRVYNITSEYFVVRILTNNDNPTARGISYVAYKTM